ncbi:MAG: hypothetical protein SGJ19_27515 [Planctomycetia bacterium]|nr:hypothetical protein [Planctomycetia bacterium]
MAKSLDQLSELVRHTEARCSADRLNRQLAETTQRLSTAQEAYRVASERSQQIKRVRQPQLDECAIDDAKLNELLPKIAQLKNHLESWEQAQKLVADSRAEIAQRRRDAEQELQGVLQEEEETRKVLVEARKAYEEVRTEIERLQPDADATLSEGDRLLKMSATFFPEGQLEALEKEVDLVSTHFDMLSREEQMSQLMVWVGRVRLLQTKELTEELHAQSRRVFRKLVGISKEHEPGFIEAFQPTFKTNWDTYIRDAEERVKSSAEARHRRADQERSMRDRQLQEEERRRAARETGRQLIDELRAAISHFNLPEEGAEEFRELVSQAIAVCGSSDEEVLELVMPYKELINEGADFRALRRNLERLQEAGADKDKPLIDSCADVRTFTQGMTALMIGGVAREDVRRQLQRVFDFDELDWQTYESSRPAILDSLEQRIRNRGLHLLLLIRTLIGHDVQQRLRPLCEQFEIPCLLVEHGYGASQIAQTIRKHLTSNAERE